MISKLKRSLERATEEGAPLENADAIALLQCGPEDMPEILRAADAVRRRTFGQRISLCSIVNAKDGSCEEDCSSCGRTLGHRNDVTTFSLLSPEKMLAAFDHAVQQPISNFGIVVGKESAGSDDLKLVKAVLSDRDHGKTSWCAAMGNLSRAQLEELQAAGLSRYHHNLETARSFFASIGSDQDYQQRIDTIKTAKELGLEVCCGGLLGLGESLEQRVEFAETLAELKVDQIPLNFLVPLPGTPLGGQPLMKPLEVLRTIAMFRLVCPQVSLKVAAGRVHLNRLQSMIFYAGCNAMMIGDLLTVAGGAVAEDLEMLEDLELEIAY